MNQWGRFALGVALLVTPDDRPLTRFKIIRGALWRDKGRSEVVPVQVERRMRRRLSTTQAMCVACGIAVFGIVRWRPLPSVSLPVVVVYLLGRAAWNLLRG